MAQQPSQPKIITPRARFISEPRNVSAHRRIVDSQDFQLAIDTALMEHTRAIVALSGKLDSDGATQAAAACFHLISGAHQLVQVFNMLSEPIAAPAAQAKIESLQQDDKN